MCKPLVAAFSLGMVFLLGPLAQDSSSPAIAETTEEAAPSSEMAGRPMSLNDCIQTALEHNLSLKVEKINPIIDQANLQIAYAGWDPSFTAGYTRNHQQDPSDFNTEFDIPIPGSSSDTDSVNAGINGLLSSGLRYDLRASITDTTGEFSRILRDEMGNPVFIDDPFSRQRGNVSLNLTQPLLRNLRIDSTRLNIKLSKVTLAQSELVLLWQIMNIVSQVELAYFDLIAAEESVKVQEKAVQLAEQLLEDNRKRVQIGTIAPLDEKQAESQLPRARADLLSAQRNLALRQNVLKNLLSDEYLEWQNIRIEATEVLKAVPIPFRRQDSWDRAMHLRPDLRQQRLNLQRNGINVQFAKNQVLPQLDVVGSIGYSAAGREADGQGVGYSGVLRQLRRRENPNWSLGGRLTIPLGNRVARNQLKIAREREKQAILQLKQFEQNIMVNVENAVTLAEINLQRVEATREEREFAEAALEAEETKLENGKSTVFVVLQLQRDLTQARSGEIQALVEYNRALSQLSLAEGATLQEREISIEAE